MVTSETGKCTPGWYLLGEPAQAIVEIVRLFVVLLVPLAALACQSSPPEVVEGGVAPEVPVILIPGITGTRLVDRHSGRVLWGNAWSGIFPHDGGYALALPLPGAPEVEPRAVAENVVLGVRVMLVHRIEVYRSVVRVMEAHGYRWGDLRRPRPSDTFFLFGYDWRQTTPEIAADLALQLEGLRQVRGKDRLTVDLVCQSSGAHIARYLLRFGPVRLEQAEAGARRPVARVEVRRLVLVGTANGGALRVLREIHRGRRYVKLGRKLQPETFFTFRSLYEGLPVADDGLFLDAGGRPLDIDLFDAATWERYGWSAFSPEARRRLDRRRPGWMPDRAGMVEFLSDVLDRGQRLHRLLRSGRGGIGAVQLFAIQGRHLPTPRRAVVVQEAGGWQTYFGGDPEMERFRLPVEAVVPGDGHATVESQLYLAEHELGAMVESPFLVDAGKHFSLILDQEAQRQMVEYLSSPPSSSSSPSLEPRPVP
jgi:hypothetical protein